MPPDVDIIDGGTQGIYLLPIIEESDRLIIIDAALPSDVEPALKIFHNEEIKALLNITLSAHQTGVHTLMAMAKMHDAIPRDVYVFAVPAVDLEMSIELSDKVRELLPTVTNEVIKLLKEWIPEKE